ncbi:hypothetical protein [Knoellia flava]|uniref:hypothetical protein n=1 Tax=Knoellia flava TaxID=913969 RepID=UPI0012ECA57B|nr:hypothetical protein [Knoellia flava]
MSHTAADASEAGPDGRLALGPAATARAERARAVLLVASFALLLLVGLALPHAAAPDLGPRGWAPGTLLPVTLGPAAVTAAMWTAYVLGGLGVLLGVLGRGAELPRPVVAVLAVGAALTAPFGSGDHLSYAAYGRILALGDNPWLESPVGWRGGTDPVVSAVEPPWTEEPSVYGPFATIVQGLTSLGGGDNLRETVWLWQLVTVASWLAIRWCLRRVLPGREARIDALWTANPLVFSVGVLGSHVDLLATALAVAAVWAAHRYAGLGGAALAGALAALALSSKFTYAVVLLALVVAFSSRRVARSAVLIAVAGVVAGGLHLWAGPNVYDQIGRSARAVSLATPWRTVFEWLGRDVEARSAVSMLAAVTAVVFALCLLRLVRSAPHAALASGNVVPRSTTLPDASEGGRALTAVAVLTGAYALAAPYSLPWYDVVVWAALPAALPGVADLVLLARLWVMSMAYTPGRVLGMTPGVEDVTMTARTTVAPVLILATWLWLVTSAVRAGSRRRPAGPPRGSAPRR